eukprot:4137812-Amphidinium_carterae.1
MYFHAEHPHLQVLLQYYSLVYVLLAGLLVDGFSYVLEDVYPILEGEDSMFQQLNATMHRSDVWLDEEAIHWWEKDLALRGNLRLLSLFSPFVAIATCTLAAVHISRVLQHDVNGLYYFPSHRQDLVIQVILLPALYSVLAFRSVVRMWALTVGASWAELALNWRWEDYVASEMLHFKANLAVADFAEMYTVYCFGCLLVDLLKEFKGTRRMSSTFSSVVMQGVYSFILAGLAQVAIVVLGSILCPLGPDMVSAMHDVSLTVEHKEGTPTQAAFAMVHVEASAAATVLLVARVLLVLASIQLIFNMYHMCRLPELQPINPNGKFMGTRILVVVAQLQFAFLESGKRYLPVLRGYSNLQINVLHASLLCYECLLVACLHLWSWPRQDYREGRLPLSDAVSDSEWSEDSVPNKLVADHSSRKDRQDPQQGAAPVSYTHLRAHETEADL